MTTAVLELNVSGMICRACEDAIADALLHTRGCTLREDLETLRRENSRHWRRKLLCLVLILAAVGTVYILRTGDGMLSVSVGEQRVRNWLGRVLLFRPRTKEFLIAYPAIAAAYCCAAHRSRLTAWLFGVFGAIGFLDDYEKLKKKQNLGLTAGKKLLLQLAAAVAFIFLMRRFGYVALDSLYIPFWNKTVPISEPLYVIFAAFVIVGTVNSVNLTDGVDGLAASTTMPVCIFFAVISILWGERFLSLGVFASGIAGGLLGFLIYNFHPAKVFMGDTGSLFLGGAVAALAFAYDMPLILVTLGIMYIIEALSDIIQVGYFKLTHGKRVFKMSPFHHHLEMGGWTGHKWKETQIVALFAGVTVLFAVLSFIGVFHRFGV